MNVKCWGILRFFMGNFFWGGVLERFLIRIDVCFWDRIFGISEYLFLKGDVKD